MASAQVNWSVEVQSPGYYQPAPQPGYVVPPPVYVAPPPPVYVAPSPPVYYRPPPPAYYPPPPAYYRPPPAYGGPGYYGGPAPYQPPKLSDMQRRALDNCVLLAPREQPRCRATVMSTTR